MRNDKEVRKSACLTRMRLERRYAGEGDRQAGSLVRLCVVFIVAPFPSGVCE